MLETSALYKSILASKHFSYTVVKLYGHNGTVYTLDHTKLSSVYTSRGSFSSSSPECGNCAMSSIELTALGRYPMPPMGRIELYVYISDGTRTSEQIPQGVYFCDTNTYISDHGVVSTSIKGYDAIGFASQSFNTGLFSWPCTALSVMQYAAETIGVQLSSDTQTALSGITIPAPEDGDYTIREIMGAIAGICGGNVVLTKNNLLKILRIGDVRPDTAYIVDEGGDRITIGGERILVY